MPFPERFRDRVAIAEAVAFGLLGGIFALWWPWPWLAAVAGPAIALVVFLIATWRKRTPAAPRPDHTEFDIEERVRVWARNAGDNARGHADQAVELAGDIVILKFQCERAMQFVEDDSARAEAAKRLRTIVDFVETRKHAPEQAVGWDVLVRHLRTAREELEGELAKLPRNS
ncbi:hypothetical protein [Saccharopolyspora shandongensis]|uniref:hypothetical protein n=1 Tax=Saccharopolyspora shandongensis TaxID=418495 RepID=UPI0033EC3717